MKVLIIPACVLASCLAQQYPEERQAHAQHYDDKTSTVIPIIRWEKDQGSDGSYKTTYETGNNILAEETGYLKPGENNTASLVQQGSYSYTSPGGEVINVQYTADEHGFHASGDHIPTPPLVSEEIQKGLDLIYAGIKAQQERAANDPDYAKRQVVENSGQYYPQK